MKPDDETVDAALRALLDATAPAVAQDDDAFLQAVLSALPARSRTQLRRERRRAVPWGLQAACVAALAAVSVAGLSGAELALASGSLLALLCAWSLPQGPQLGWR